MSALRSIAISVSTALGLIVVFAVVFIDYGLTIDPAFHRMASHSENGAFEQYVLGRGQEAIPGLIQCLHSADPEVRYRSAWMLDELAQSKGISSPEAVTPLCHAVADSSPLVRLAAVRALGKFLDPRVVTALIPAARDEDDQVCWAALEILGQRKDERALPVIIEDLQSGSRTTRFYAAQALREFPAADLLAPIREVFPRLVADVRHEMNGIWERAGNAAVPDLIGCLADPDPKQRQLAADTLGRMHDARAIPPLLHLLDDSDQGVRWLARNALRALPLSDDQRAILKAHGP